MKYFQLLKFSIFISALSVPVMQPVFADEAETITETSQIETPAKFSIQAADLLAQEPNAAIPITAVRLNRTETELVIILETSDGKALQVDASKFTSEGNALIADIPNAVLALPNGQAFQAENPTTDITKVTVEQQSPTSIRISVVGNNALPTTDVVLKTGSFSYSLNSDPEGTEEEIVVTGQGEDNYFVPDATTATKTDTPLRDIPASIQVIPRQVLEDQKITRISDAVRNVSGVVVEGSFGSATDNYNIRGFVTFNNLRNGFSGGDNYINPISIERIEVLKGPTSVLYGQFEPGGVVNYVTKQPLDFPYYSGEFIAGSYNYYRPSIDLSGPLTGDKKLLYRFNAAYESYGSFIDFVDGNTFAIAPVLSYKISDSTTLALEYEHSSVNRTFDDGLPPSPEVLNVPISSFYGEPFNNYKLNTDSGTLTLEHRFNDNVKLRSAFSFIVNTADGTYVRPDSVDEDGRSVLRRLAAGPSYFKSFAFQNNLISQFKTGFVRHQVLLGLDLGWDTNAYDFLRTPFSSIDLFDPIYGAPPLESFETAERFKSTTNTVGIYLQDQITLLPNLKLLVGGRYDLISYKDRNIDLNNNGDLLSESDYTDSAFSPRVGLVYQPIKPVSLYASFSQSFIPNYFFRGDGNSFLPPSRGTQYEVGVKADLMPDKLSATLAAYEITKTNVPTTDPNNTDFSIATGNVKSRGIEFDLAGQPLPGWNIIASFFLNDTFVSKDNDLPIGDRLVNAPSQGASFWTTYEIQKGNFKGIGFGTGLFFVGDKEAQLPNTFEIPAYVRVDASLFYKRDRWRVGVNFKNLFNETYYESQGNFLRAGAPFTVLGSISVEF